MAAISAGSSLIGEGIEETDGVLKLGGSPDDWERPWLTFDDGSFWSVLFSEGARATATSSLGCDEGRFASWLVGVGDFFVSMLAVLFRAERSGT